MPNYEELYYIARNHYYEAIEERNTIRRRTSELQARKTTLTRQLREKQETLHKAQQKKALVQDALSKSKEILNSEFPAMKSDLLLTGEEYKKIITSDQGVADLSTIYADDLANTKSELESIISDHEQALRSLEEQETTAQTAVTSCSSELNSVTSQLKNVGSESAAQRKINNYYAEMMEYKIKWQNGN